MKIFPGMHYTMGGLWVDFNQMTNIPGIFAAGECEYQYHGANRLGANSLVSCIFGGFGWTQRARVREELARRRGRWRPAAEVARQSEINRSCLTMKAPKSFQAVARTGRDHDRARHRHPLQQGLKQADEKIVELLDRYKRVNLSDKSQWANTSFAFARQLKNMLELSRTMVLGAILRDESRGAHYKPDFPDRNDKQLPQDHQSQLHWLR